MARIQVREIIRFRPTLKNAIFSFSDFRRSGLAFPMGYTTRLVYFLYFAGAFRKAAGNTPLRISATWEIERHRK